MFTSTRREAFGVAMRDRKPVEIRRAPKESKARLGQEEEEVVEGVVCGLRWRFWKLTASNVSARGGKETEDCRRERKEKRRR